MNLLREYIRELLSERDARKSKTKRTLYHINKYRPARPQPKMRYLQQWVRDATDPDTGERTGDFVDTPGTDVWERWWLDSPVKSGVFLTPNPVDIAMNHGRTGHVYAYKVPEWVIEKSGGIHRYDHGSEILIPEDIWNEAGKEIEFLGKSMDRAELYNKIDKTQIHGKGNKRKATKPSWLSDDELKAWEDRRKQFNITGLRATNHPEDAVKMLSQEEIESAIAVLEKEYAPKPDHIIPAEPGDRKGYRIPAIQKKPTEKDEELLMLLKKRLSETIIRTCIRELLQEKKFSDLQVPKGVWEKIPLQYISSEPDEEGLDREIFDLISTAYSSLPGGNIKVKTPDDVPGEYTFFDVVDVDDDPQPDAVVFGKVRGNALKIGGMGHDGAKGKRVSITRLIELLKQPGFFAEVSGVPALIALNAGVPVVEDEQKVRDLIKRDLEWVGEVEGKDGRGWYKRQYGPGVYHLKIVVGSV